ncbi:MULTISPECIES: YibE/F family protein [Corynebacterium]|uniref:YibE/F family protein n=1 Tax=Corynebacterium TaxID=1716 RepID=UPI001E2CDDE4|nr:MULTISPECIES: YibE/F family protein [Corynebacterium]MCT1410781.1 YibE/F family protein [Corynebacterium accolens]MDK4261144.1 YibE/F family protein [Corynebacterium accolens]MDK4263325.1 YibE/F family protein [Corynebacterium accolens]MDK4271090.1 YibE/F family protein [Corynebacterium accolens]MDK8711279.1 YibE/F family protein [Corynebacterium accolens]
MLIGLVLLWPSSATSEHTSEEFESTYALNHPQVEATVEKTDHSACQSEQTGLAFDTPPLIPEKEEVDCDRALVKITSGEDEGKMTQLVTYGNAGDPELQPGDNIVLSKATDPTGSVSYAFADYQRSNSLLLWGVVIAIVIIAFAAWHGVRAIIGLGLSLGIVFSFLIPALIAGTNPLWVALAACTAIILLAVPLVHGVNWKSASAVGGSLTALAIAAFLAWAAIDSSQLQGYSSEDNLKLLLYMPNVSILGVLLCGFVVGALGSLADVAIAQASTITELHESDSAASPLELFLSAMRVGRDHIASMVYTLILTYTGAALPLLLLITAAERPAGQILSSDLVATELLRSGVGAMALTLAVPITTLIAAFTVPSRRR